MELYRLLKRLHRGARNKGIPFQPRQKKLAEMAKVCRRTIQLRLDELESAGLIARRRTNRSDRYYFPEQPDCAFEGATDCASEGAKNCASETEAPLVKTCLKNNSSAAADLFVPIHIQEASAGLLSLGFPCPLADRYGRKNPELVLEALPFLRWKIQVKRDVRDKVKVIRSVLNDPANWGFEKDSGGKWRAPRFGEEENAKPVAGDSSPRFTETMARLRADREHEEAIKGGRTLTQLRRQRGKQGDDA